MSHLCLISTGKLLKMEHTHTEASAFTVVYSLVIIVSLLGNTLLIYIVWKKPEVRSLTSFMFVNMAVADLLVTLVMMPWSIAFFHTEGLWLIEGYLGEITCRGVIFIAHVTLLASILCLTFIAVDRFYAVVHPFRRHVWFRNAKVLTPLTWSLSIVLMSIVPVSYHLDAQSSNCSFKLEIWGNETAGIRGVFLYLFFITYFFPLCTTSILYAKTAHTLWFRQVPGDRPLAENHQQQQQEVTKRRVVRNLIIIVAVFALCWLPAQVYHLFIAVTAWAPVPPVVMYLVFWIAHANSAINPWLCITLNSKMSSQVSRMTWRIRHPRNANDNRVAHRDLNTTVEDSLV